MNGETFFLQGQGKVRKKLQGTGRAGQEHEQDSRGWVRQHLNRNFIRQNYKNCFSNGISLTTVFLNMKIYQIQGYPSYCLNQMIIADTCHDWQWCTLIELLYFFANRSQNFGLLWPIWAILLQIYALVGVLLHAEIMRQCTKIDKYQVCE